jgi:hypothetical protein
VAAIRIGEQLGHQIAPGLGPLDQMVVRVDDRQIGFENLLAVAREPIVARGEMPGGRDRCGGRHGFLL